MSDARRYTVCPDQGQGQGQGYKPLISYAIYNGSWQLTTDS